MRTATTIEASAGNWRDNLALGVEAEHLGLDLCLVSEAWGSDAPSPLGYLAARTEHILLGSGTLQLGTRSPAVIASTALTISEMSSGRFILGLGSSGPQVVEGLHGVPFAHPLGRMRETVEVIREIFHGGKIDYQGRHVQIPLPNGDALPMRTSLSPNPDLPIYLAALMPKMLSLTGEIADGWLGSSFVPEGAAAYLKPLEAGARRAGRTLAELDLCEGAEVNFVNEDELATTLASRKKELAFSLGGMGSASTNFYNSAYSSQGWAEVARQVRTHWQAGRHQEAAAVITDDMVLATTLIGTDEMIRDRLRTWRDTGITTVRFYPAGDTLAQRIDTLGRAIDIVRDLNAHQPATTATDSPTSPEFITRS